MSYLDEQGVSLYLRDALVQLKYLRRQNKPMKTTPGAATFEPNQIAQFLAEYCRSVQFGTHLYRREFSYVMLTTRNRLSFSRLVEKQFLPGVTDTPLLPVDFHGLVELLCPDLPRAIVDDCFALLPESPQQVGQTLADLLRALRFRLLFDQFYTAARVELGKTSIVVPIDRFGGGCTRRAT